MKAEEKKNSFLKTIILMIAGLALTAGGLWAAQGDDSQAPGRTMAQQATKTQRIWTVFGSKPVKHLEGTSFLLDRQSLNMVLQGFAHTTPG